MSDSPAAILFDVNGNPVGTVIDGVFYRLQVEAKLAAGTNTVGKVDQGAAGAAPWPVDIQGATVSVSNLQQLSIITKLSSDNFNLQISAYNQTAPFAADGLLSILELRFSTIQSRDITISLNDGTIIWETIADTSLNIEIDFEDYPIDSGTSVTVLITQTGGACLVDVTMTAKVGTAALGGNPVLGESTSHIGSVSLTSGNSSASDAFSRLRTSNPKSLLEVTHQYDLVPRLMGLYRQDAGTSITHSSPVAILSVPAILGRKIIHQSHQHCIYLPGKSHLIRITGQLDNGVSISGMGYGDDNDGIFLENGATGMQIRFISSTIDDQLIDQEDWNLDVLDGYGVSGVVLNTNAAQQLIIDLSWLGAGRVRVGLDIGGQVIYVHQFNFSNIVSTAYTRTASLPIRWYLESLGSASTMQAICAAVSSEGGSDPFGVEYSIARTTSKATLAAGVRTPLISLRSKATFNSIVNNVHLILRNISFLGATADNLLIELIFNGALTGASWTSVDANSHAEYDQSATAITGGTPIFNDYASSQSRGLLNNSFNNNLKLIPITLNVAGVSDIITICVTRIEGAANCYAGFNWLEAH